MNNFLRHLSIRQRLLGSMVVLSVLIVGMGLWATLTLRASQSEAEHLLAKQTALGQSTTLLYGALERVQRLEQSVLLTGNNAVEAEEHQKAWATEIKATRELFKDKLPENVRKGQMAEGLAGFETYAKEVAPVLQQVVAATMDSGAGYAYASRNWPELEKARTGFKTWAEQAQAQLSQEQSRTRDRENMQSTFLMGAVAVMMVLFGVLMWNVVRSIVGPLGQAMAAARRIAGGDLCQPLKVEGQDEVARFMQTLNHMQTSLHAVVSEVRTTADSIRIASDEVATGNMDLSQRTEHTASNLQQTAASMEQLTDTVRHSAEASTQASGLASSASSVAQQGGDAVAQVVNTMNDINQASRKIADITSVIDGIAFQTNILALNAAVEAARAGEQGRGFAVVAGEVRSLAKRSADAAREIKELIGASVSRIEAGSRQVALAGATMSDIVSSVRRVDDIIQDITSASSQQSQGIGQVNAAVTQLDQMTQQNAALVEESAAAAESLKQQAARLSDVVATFRLHADDPVTAV